MSISKIAESTVTGSPVSQIDFTSISGSYTDLMIVCSLREGTTSNEFLGSRLKLNGSSSITVRMIQGSGSSAASYTNTVSDFGPGISGGSTTANTFGSTQFYIPNYASTTTNKSISYDGAQENNTSTAYMTITAGLYASTAAITSLTIYGVDPSQVQRNLAVGSSVSLYGVTKGSLAGVTVN